MQDSSVDITIKLRTEGQRARSPILNRGMRLFSSPQFPDRLWLPLRLFILTDTESNILGVKAAGRIPDHSPLYDVSVKNACSYTASWRDA